jgi:predicted transcriptional regulator
MTWILPRQLHTLACALDTAALSLDCTEQSEVCAQSLFVRSKPSQSQTWLRKWKRDSWTQHLSGRILRPSLGQRFATEWTSSLGATHASPSVQPGSEKVSKTRGIFGRLLQMVFDFSDPSSASLKTSKDISRWGCPTSSKTWQEWVIERRGAYSARLNAERRIEGSESSSWPTVRHGESWQGHGATQSYAENGANHQVNYRYNKQGEKISIPKGTFDTTLTTAVIAQNWLSPVASELRQGFQDRFRGMKGSQESLTTVVIKHGPPAPASSSTDGSRPGLSVANWITPQAQEAGARVETLFTKDGRPAIPGQRAYRKTPSGKLVLQSQTINQQVEMVEKQWQTATVSTGAHRQKDGSMIDKLDQQVKNWATPANHDGTTGTKVNSPFKSLVGDVEKITPLTQGKLNPRWVETLMGLPVGWTMPSCASPVIIERTNSDCSGMESCRQQRNEPSEC